MTKDIPNADLIRAVLDGQVVQVTPGGDHAWTDMDPAIAVSTLVRAASGLRFRLKPRSVIAWIPLLRTPEGLVPGAPVPTREEIPAHLPEGPVARVLRLEFDAYSGEPAGVRAVDAGPERASERGQRPSERPSDRFSEPDLPPAPEDLRI
ncbi:hypothetical protein [Ramlibacter algicola]|uniref:Uncharacterized protein n=1 Tax=Ramlibacter algicola TaxID=2795217 RepID=A0A934UQ94_9BURK|nr:hypothetical protein [Ramlibacter algicola]MBK0391885.1 hypothetical protein [Ramlibacter algicola]